MVAEILVFKFFIFICFNVYPKVPRHSRVWNDGDVGNK